MKANLVSVWLKCEMAVPRELVDWLRGCEGSEAEQLQQHLNILHSPKWNQGIARKLASLLEIKKRKGQGSKDDLFKSPGELKIECAEKLESSIRDMQKNMIRPSVITSYPFFAWMQSPFFGKCSGKNAQERRDEMFQRGELTCPKCLQDREVAQTHRRSSGPGICHSGNMGCLHGVECSKEVLNRMTGGPRAVKRFCAEEKAAESNTACFSKLFYELRGLSVSELQRTRSFIDELLEQARDHAGVEALSSSSSSDRAIGCSPPEGLVGNAFDPKVDQYRKKEPKVDTNFAPRSPKVYNPGALSVQAGGPAWWLENNFHERLETMNECFRRRDALDSLQGFERQLCTADLACYKRLNPRSRKTAKATKLVYAFYERHLSTCFKVRNPDKVQIGAEFLLNVVLMRNTLSLAVRDALVSCTFVWLKLEGTTIMNLTELDKFYGKAGGQIFGTYVNPMRRRSERPKQGYAELCNDLYSFADVAYQLTANFFASYEVQALLDALMKVPGFGGSGFRSKELLCDFVDHMHIFLSAEPLASVNQQYSEIVVIGVGPCRTCNYFYNLPFLHNEKMNGSEKTALYKPALVYILRYLREHWPSDYENRTNLDILYEMCEHSKNLFAWFCDIGLPYVPTVYGREPPPVTGFAVSEIAAFRTSSLRMTTCLRRFKQALRDGSHVLVEGDDDIA